MLEGCIVKFASCVVNAPLKLVILNNKLPFPGRKIGSRKSESSLPDWWKNWYTSDSAI